MSRVDADTVPEDASASDQGSHGPKSKALSAMYATWDFEMAKVLRDTHLMRTLLSYDHVCSTNQHSTSC